MEGKLVINNQAALILKLSLSLLMFFAANSPSDATLISMEEKLEIGDTMLILNGAGFRVAFGLRMYMGGLYLLKKSNTDQDIIDADAAMAVRMKIVSPLITSDRLEKSTLEGFNYSTNNNLAPIDTQISRFISIIKQNLKNGDIFTFIYRPNRGTEILKNNQSQGIIDGYLFKKALFGIWLCERPAQKELKKAMLGN